MYLIWHSLLPGELLLLLQYQQLQQCLEGLPTLLPKHAYHD